MVAKHISRQRGTATVQKRPPEGAVGRSAAAGKPAFIPRRADMFCILQAECTLACGGVRGQPLTLPGVF